MEPPHSYVQPSLTLDRTDLGTLTLTLNGLRNCDGAIYAALFAGPDGFPNQGDKAVRAERFAIDAVDLTIAFEHLPFGRYAATLHHDENLDGELNCNLLGIPKEGIGFSGNPPIWRGVPPYQRAEFEFSPENRIISITMKYLLP